jgi:hypothetical protein
MRYGWILFLGMVLLGVTSQMTLADTTVLLCHVSSPGITEDETTIIKLDEAQHSVVLHFGAYHVIGASVNGVAVSAGPLRATFNTDTITFTLNSNDIRDGNYVMNRLTGAVFSHRSGWRYTCQVGGKPIF